MGNAMFYHLTRSPAEKLLVPLIAKSQEQGWRVELRGADASRMSRLDEMLWQGDGFLPHGLAGGPHDALQPILLTSGGQPAGNDPACLIALDGSAVTAEECAALDRVCILFDGGNEAAKDRARDQWRNLTGAGITAEYWSEESGRWQKLR